MNHEIRSAHLPGALPSLWALSLAFLGGAAAVTNPNLKGLLMRLAALGVAGGGPGWPKMPGSDGKIPAING